LVHFTFGVGDALYDESHNMVSPFYVCFRN
jgi:hypothetical protein